MVTMFVAMCDVSVDESRPSIDDCGPFGGSKDGNLVALVKVRREGSYRRMNGLMIIPII
jgi:hypothetical protein